MSSMEAVTQYVDRKSELEERIQLLESERASVIAVIASLKEKLAILELERNATSLANEVEALRTEKTVLEEKIATYAIESPAVGDGYQV